MARFRPFSAAVALAGYLLATTIVHSLHDHSTHCGSCSDAGCPAACEADHGTHGEAPATNCEDSCFACRFLAVKSIAPAIVALPEQVEAVCAAQTPDPLFGPVVRLSLPLSRAPPRV